MYGLRGSPISYCLATFMVALCLCAGCSESAHRNCANPSVAMTTTMGTITLELDAARAPISVANFLEYVDASFYDSTIIHRVVPGFIIQGGQYTQNLDVKEPRDPIICEAYNGLSNLRGTIAVARAYQPNSGTCQFFINSADNKILDGSDNSGLAGYAVFGRVTAGMEVVDAIGGVPTSTQETPHGSPLQHVPVTPVIILSVRHLQQHADLLVDP
jgi:cyclophilin family peptidyl-prolyl cis-trans isomerase